ncbi:MAG: Flp family type IVb pilin [Planctomycetes bacterium]|nr:Flp family type IVb pilin [Planctomycetota bacterium]
MKRFVKRVRDLLRSQDGTTAVEYAVMLALIVMLAIGTITALGTSVKGAFANANTELAKAPGGT